MISDSCDRVSDHWGGRDGVVVAVSVIAPVTLLYTVSVLVTVTVSLTLFQ